MFFPEVVVDRHSKPKLKHVGECVGRIDVSVGKAQKLRPQFGHVLGELDFTSPKIRLEAANKVQLSSRGLERPEGQDSPSRNRFGSQGLQ